MKLQKPKQYTYVLVLLCILLFAVIACFSFYQLTQEQESPKMLNDRQEFELSDINDLKVEPSKDSDGLPATVIAPEAVYEEKDLSQVQEQLDLIYQENAGVSSAYMDIKSGAHVSSNGDEPKVAASMIKLLILAEFLSQTQTGSCSLEETYTVQASDIVGGSGTVQHNGAGTEYSLGDLASLMISVSDNTAANILIDKLGMDNINAQAGNLGLTATSLNRYMMDYNAINAGLDNFITANDAVKLLYAFYNGQVWREDLCEFAMQALYGQTISTSLWNSVPPQSSVGHKTGNLDGVSNDAGIVNCDNPYILVALCSDMDNGVSSSVMAQISEIGLNASENISG